MNTELLLLLTLPYSHNSSYVSNGRSVLLRPKDLGGVSVCVGICITGCSVVHKKVL